MLQTRVDSGLDGVIVADTVMSEVDGEEGRLVVLDASPEQFQKHGVAGNDTEGLVDEPRTIAGVEVVVLFSEVEHHFVQTHFQRDGADDVVRLEKVLAQVTEQGRAGLSSEGYAASRARLDRFADVRYAGQSSELTIPIAPGTLTPTRLAELREAFAVEHEKTYGYRSDGEAVQIVGLRLVARGLSPTARVPERLRLVADAAPASASRQAYFGPQEGWRETPVRARQMLTGRPCDGPLIIEEYDATTLVPPGWQAQIDPDLNIVLDRQEGRNGNA